MLSVLKTLPENIADFFYNFSFSRNFHDFTAIELIVLSAIALSLFVALILHISADKNSETSRLQMRKCHVLIKNLEQELHEESIMSNFQDSTLDVRQIEEAAESAGLDFDKIERIIYEGDSIQYLFYRITDEDCLIYDVNFKNSGRANLYSFDKSY